MFRVLPPLIIWSANNCIYSIWYLSHRYCYMPLSWKSWKSVATLHSILRVYLGIALHVSGVTSTHHLERKLLYLQHLVFVTPLLLHAAIMEELEIRCNVTKYITSISENCSTCFGWYLHPSSGAQTTISTASGIIEDL